MLHARPRLARTVGWPLSCWPWQCRLPTKRWTAARPAPTRISASALFPGTWQRADAIAFLFYVQQISDDAQRRLLALSRHFRLAHSEATQNAYWANHCEHCGTLMDDHELHCEPDGAFTPSTEAAAAQVELVRIDDPLHATTAGYSLEPEFLRFMRRS